MSRRYVLEDYPHVNPAILRVRLRQQPYTAAGLALAALRISRCGNPTLIAEALLGLITLEQALKKISN